ncbi:hypothetical protein C8Q80DRAFT_148184 [Daedaleopsis nitida]|nr:hypothetical protein C8Q80DRAFT_148184 [Daedaleopsis nitida]
MVSSELHYTSLIVSYVQRSIHALNDAAGALQKVAPLSSDILDVNYPQCAIDRFRHHCQLVHSNLHAASKSTSAWYRETGSDGLSQRATLHEAERVEGSIQEATASLPGIHAQIENIKQRTVVLQKQIDECQERRSTLESETVDIRKKMRTDSMVGGVCRIGAAAAAPHDDIFSLILTAFDVALLGGVVKHKHERALEKIEFQLKASDKELNALFVQLGKAEDEGERLSERVCELKEQIDDWRAETQRLQGRHAELEGHSKRVASYMHAVDAALSSSETVTGSTYSMRKIVAGLRGVVDALSAECLFASSLEGLDKSALDRLDDLAQVMRYIAYAES